MLKGAVKPNDRVRVHLRDYDGRILLTQDLAPKGKKASFTFKLDRVRTILVRVQAELVEGDRAVDAAESIVIVPRRQFTGFPVLMWEAGGFGVLGHYERQQIRQWGFQTVYKHPRDGRGAFNVAMDDLVFSSYSTRICGHGDVKGVRRPAPLEDPKWRAKLGASLRKSTTALKKFRPVALFAR